ncbi:MAG: glycerate kinase [Bacillota bacterium]
MNIAVFIDSYKGTLSSIELSNMIEAHFKATSHNVFSLPISDGGEGFIEAIETVYPDDCHRIPTEDPLGNRINAKYVLKDKTAYIGLYTAAGLALLKKESLNPLKTSSFGVGLIILDAIKKGAEKIVLGIGGSATNDGASGMLQALGVRFFNGNVEIEERMTGGLLDQVTSVDTRDLETRIKNTVFVVASDVKAPLLGPKGSAHVFSTQKGADKDKREYLEKAMAHYADVVETHTGRHHRHDPGAGAAGGVGFGALSLLKAEMVSGIDFLIELVDIESIIKQNDIVIVGEGRLDDQTSQGKAPYGIAKLAKRHNKMVIGLFGSIEGSPATDYIDEVYAVAPQYAPYKESLLNPMPSFLKMLQDVKIPETIKHGDVH